MASRSRIFYDPNNPVMLRPEEIVRLTPSEVQAASDQIDQNMVLLLQRIEENFDKCNTVVTERILPAVQQHGENSRRIYESIKFWRPFFEKAAKIKLNDPYLYDEHSSTQEGDITARGATADHSISFEEGASATSATERVILEEGTPRATTKTSTPATMKGGNDKTAAYSDEMSPFQALQADLHHIRPTSSATEQATGGIQRLRLGDLPPDSPDVPIPEWETATTVFKSAANAALEAPSPSLSSIAFESSPPGTLHKKRQLQTAASTSSPQRVSVAASKHHPALLEKILRKNVSSPAPLSATPGRKGKLARPSEVPRDWDGLVDLSNTSLAAFASPIKRQGDAADESGWDASSQRPKNSSSPAPGILRLNAASLASISFSPAPSRTPAKEAAKRMTRDVYSALGNDSPIEPPSVMKEFTTMYNTTKFPAPSPSEGLRKGFEEEALDEEEEEGEDGVDSSRSMGGTTRLGRGTLLAEFGGGTTARIDDLLNENSFAHIVDDGDDFGTQRVDLQDESFTDDLVPSNDGSRAAVGFALHGQSQHQDDFDEGISRDAARNLDGPEDTLFGMKAAARSKTSGHNASMLEEEEDSFADGMGATRNFRMLGPDNLDTLHGGVLLESEPFESSPLAGRDRKDY